MRAIPHPPLSSVILLGAVVALLAGCGTEPESPPFQTYAVSYVPGSLVGATEQCDHLVTHVVLEVGDDGNFELSANVQDDCTRGGGGFTDGEVFRIGTFTRQGGTLSFTSQGAAAPEFSGQLDLGAIVLVFVPGVDSLSTPVNLRVPRVQTGPTVP
jgi:hypothetical protein